MSSKNKKLKKYKLGGDILRTGLNVWTDATGMSGFTDPLFGNAASDGVDNEFLQNVNNISNDYLAPTVNALLPTIMNAAAPGSGSIYSGLQQGAQIAGTTINQPKSQGQAQQINVDPRYINRAKGGPLIQENITNQLGTDTIPTDAQGNPAISSGNKAIAMTDAGEVMWNGYVFSKKLGYADRAKAIMKKFKFRLGENFENVDDYDMEAMNGQLAKLAQEQEVTRPQNKDEGGLPTAEYGRVLSNLNNTPLKQTVKSSIRSTNADALTGAISPQDTLLPEIGDFISNPTTAGTLAQAIPLAMRGINLAMNQPDAATTPKYMPEEIDLSDERRAIERRSRDTKGTLASRSSSPTERIAGITAVDQNTTEALGNSFMREATSNVDITNRAGLINAQLTHGDLERQSQEEAAYQQATDALMADIANAGVGIVNDKQKRKVQEIILKNLKSRNFAIDPTLSIGFIK